MRRRLPDLEGVGYPPGLDVFDVGDWWTKDPEDPAELGYAKIIWCVARRAYREGGDWQAHRSPPAWAAPSN